MRLVELGVLAALQVRLERRAPLDLRRTATKSSTSRLCRRHACSGPPQRCTFSMNCRNASRQELALRNRRQCRRGSSSRPAVDREDRFAADRRPPWPPCCQWRRTPRIRRRSAGTSQVFAIVRLKRLPLHAAPRSVLAPARPVSAPCATSCPRGERACAVPRSPRTSDRDRDPDADLDAEDVVRRAAEFRVVPDIAVQVQVVDSREVLQQVLPHPVEGDLVDEAVVGDEAHDAVAAVRAGPLPSGRTSRTCRKARSCCVAVESLA